MAKLSGLGRGLESLIPRKSYSDDSSRAPAEENLDSKRKENVFLIEIDKIKSNPLQPRRDFNQEELENLAQSIREVGILQPLIVTKTESESFGGLKVGYELIAGERRLRAARMAGLSLVPAIIHRKALEKQKLELALVENVQRANLNPLEKARAFERLHKEFGLGHEDIAQRVGQSRSTVTNTMRLLRLPGDIQKAITEGKITEGHARNILALNNEKAQRAFLNEIISKNLSVRSAEYFVRQAKGMKYSKTTKRGDPQAKEFEARLEDFLGTRVKVLRVGLKGRISIEFYSPEELEAIVTKIFDK